MAENLGHSYTKIGPFIYFLFKKRVYHTPGGAKERGLFGMHIRTISYIGRSPPPPRGAYSVSKTVGARLIHVCRIKSYLIIEPSDLAIPKG